jgi:EmrB/QacA subfamily drug resistance transporter
MSLDGRKRWLALLVLCFGDLMIVLDVTIVNVALPSIRADLGFSETSLAWVVNAYLITFGGFLLLGGRLGDLFGHRRLFLIGLTVFTLASLACGLATSQEFLVAARAVQGLGGAVVSVVALSLTMIMFTEPAERAKAMGIFGFVLSGGGTVGVLLGGVLTDLLDWHWIFLVNLPVGVAVVALSLALLPAARAPAEGTRLDVAGAVTVTASLMLAVYAIVSGNETGWGTGQTLGLLAASAALLILFLVIEARARSPLVPLGLFRLRNLTTANAVGVLMAGGMFAAFFLSALYLQQVLGYTPLEVGLAYLPSTVIWGTASFALSDKLVMRFGIKPPLLAGLSLMAVGILLFARAPVDANFAVDILPGMVLQGLGAGIGFNPILLAAMGDVEPREAGLASGVVNTSFMMGGALGLAVIASLADSRTDTLLASGEGEVAALLGGYHVGFLVGALFAGAAAVLGGVLLRAPRAAPAHEPERRLASPRPPRRNRPSARLRSRCNRPRGRVCGRPPRAVARPRRAAGNRRQASAPAGAARRKGTGRLPSRPHRRGRGPPVGLRRLSARRRARASRRRPRPGRAPCLRRAWRGSRRAGWSRGARCSPPDG